MQFTKTDIPGIILIQPKILGDDRGYFYESYHAELFSKNGIDKQFVQDNQSFSHKGVLRGLHFQNPPFAQGKLIRVVQGSVLDIALDIRMGSPTYGKYFSEIVSSEKQNMIWIPEGFAHGFITLQDNTIFQYKCTNYYNKEVEGCILWNDNDLKIDWNIENPIISEKDKLGIPFSSYNSKFIF